MQSPVRVCRPYLAFNAIQFAELSGHNLLATPLESTVCVGTLVEHGHGLISGADLHLQEVCIWVLALGALGCMKTQSIRVCKERMRVRPWVLSTCFQLSSPPSTSSTSFNCVESWRERTCKAERNHATRPCETAASTADLEGDVVDIGAGLALEACPGDHQQVVAVRAEDQHGRITQSKMLVRAHNAFFDGYFLQCPRCGLPCWCSARQLRSTPP